MHLVADGPSRGANGDDALGLNAGAGQPPGRKTAEGTHELCWTRHGRLASHESPAIGWFSLGPSNTKISCEGRHRECPDLVSCILLFYGLSFVQPRMNYVIERRWVCLRQVRNDTEPSAVKLRGADLFEILRHGAHLYVDVA